MSKRYGWVDIAKGFSIILVVVLHSSFIDTNSTLYSEAIVNFNELFNRVRMPLFFFISALFVHKALSMNLRSFYKFKVIHLLYLYVLWSIIRFVTSTVPEVFVFGGEKENLLGIFTIFYNPPNTLWFIYALLIFLLFTRLIQNYAYTALAIAIVLYLTKSHMGLDGTFVGDRLITYYPFYLLGLLTSGFTKQTFSNFKIYYPVVLIAYFSILIVSMDASWAQTRPAALLFSLGGVVAGIMIAVILEKTTYFFWLEYIGKNTLPIYVLHYLPVGFLKIALPSLIPNSPLMALVITAGAGIVFPLVVMVLSKKINAHWLFSVPFNKTKFKEEPAS